MSREPGLLPKNALAEGCMLVLTDYDTVCVSPETWEMCMELYKGRGLSPATINRRANDAALAIATYVAKKAWARGEGAGVV